MSPHPEREAEAIGVLREAGVAEGASVFTTTRSGLGNAWVMVAAACELTVIEAEYRQFLGEFSARAPGDVLTGRIELVHASRRFPSIDPGLPPELLPDQWSGLEAARLLPTDRPTDTNSGPPPHGRNGYGSTTPAEPPGEGNGR